MHAVRGRRTRAGVLVDAESAMRHSAWWACVNLLANIVAMLPVDEFRDGPDGRVEVPSDPLLREPSYVVSASRWRRQVMVSWLTRGNVFGWVLDATDGTRPTKIEILDPSVVTAHRPDRSGPVRWRVMGEPVDLWPVGRFLHRPALTVPGSEIGLSPISYAAQAIGLGLAAEEFGAQWFGEGGHPSAVLQTEQRLDDPRRGAVDAAAIKARFLEATRGGGPAVLGAGLEYKAIQIAPNESQFLETIKANVTTVARFFNLPPELIGGDVSGSNTYANREQRALDLLTYAVQPWVTLFEEFLTDLVARPRYVKLNTDALVRPDLMTRYRAHEIGIRNGWLSRNEVRALEDRRSIGPDGDELLWPPYRTLPTVDDRPAMLEE